MIKSFDSGVSEQQRLRNLQDISLGGLELQILIVHIVNPTSVNKLQFICAS